MKFSFMYGTAETKQFLCHAEGFVWLASGVALTLECWYSPGKSFVNYRKVSNRAALPIEPPPSCILR